VNAAAELAFVRTEKRHVRDFGILNGVLLSDGAATLVLADHPVSLGCHHNQGGFTVDVQAAQAARISLPASNVASVSVDGIELAPEGFTLAGEMLTVQVAAGIHQVRVSLR
jgi:hypothetical protein